jgi:adenosine deaminase
MAFCSLLLYTGRQSCAALPVFFCPACLVLAAAACCPVARFPRSSPEARAARAYKAAAKAGPPGLRAFLADFPKGADLHVHLSGAVYAESFIRDAGEDGLCVDPPRSVCQAALRTTADSRQPSSGNITSANQDLYDRLIDSFSMRSFVPTRASAGTTSSSPPLAALAGSARSHTGEWVDEVASRAAAQNQQYLELMETPPFSHARRSPTRMSAGTRTLPNPQSLLDHGLRDEVPPIAKTSAPPSRSAARSSTAEPRRPRPPARSRFATSTRFCAVSAGAGLRADAARL